MPAYTETVFILVPANIAHAPWLLRAVRGIANSWEATVGCHLPSHFPWPFYSSPSQYRYGTDVPGVASTVAARQVPRIPKSRRLLIPGALPEAMAPLSSPQPHLAAIHLTYYEQAYPFRLPPPSTSVASSSLRGASAYPGQRRRCLTSETEPLFSSCRGTRGISTATPVPSLACWLFQRHQPRHVSKHGLLHLKLSPMVRLCAQAQPPVRGWP